MEECAKEIDRILEEIYSDIRNTPLLRKIKSALVEASKKIIKIKHEEVTKENVNNYANTIAEIEELVREIDNGAIAWEVRKCKQSSQLTARDALSAEEM